MSRRRWFGARVLASFIWATAALLGCAEEVGDIDRTQANRLKKADLLGSEWYFGQTVLKNPSTSGFTMQLYGGILERVRFVIDEKYLLAYRSYEFIPGTEPRQDAEEMKTEILAAYRIESHFDIVREYNPTTGEESNVISENTTDRQWWEREYMRVDWSQNLAPNIDPRYEWFTWHVFNISHVAPLSYFVQDTPAAEADPDRAEFDFADGTFSFVNRYAVEPNLDECLNYVFFQIDCGPAEVKVRNVFKRIDGPSTYQPLEYRDTLPLTWDDGRPLMYEFDNARGGVVACPPATHPYTNESDCYPEEIPVWNKFGFLRIMDWGQPTWDRERGATWEGRRSKAIRHDIWMRSLTDEACDQDADCAATAGSKCDTELHRCTIPFKDRVPRPIKWVFTYDYPERLKPLAQQAVDKWDAVFMRLLRELDNPYGQKDGFRMVVLEDNNCSPTVLTTYLRLHPQLQKVVDRVLGEAGAGKSPADFTLDQRARVCAALDYNTRNRPDHFTWEKQGELGLNMLPWVDQYQIGMPLGMMMPWNDPVTGEMIHTYASVWGASLDTYVSWAADVVDVLNGKLALDEVLYGVNVRNEIHGITRDNDGDEENGEVHPKQSILRDHFDRMQQRMDDMLRKPTSDEVLQELNARFTRLGSRPAELLREIPAGMGRGMLERIRETELERRLISHEMMRLFNPGWMPGDPVSDEMVERASPLTWLYGKGREEQDRRIRNAARYHVDLGEFVEDKIVGLAMEYRDLSRAELYETLYATIYEATLLHEMGHAFGLAHNFEASMDALNYLDGYWDIRTRLEQEAAEQGWDEVTLKRKQDEARMSEYQYSSIMDYGSTFNSDLQGLGKYDEAAILFGYGNLIELWDDDLKLDLDADPLSNAGQDYFDLASAIFLRTADHLIELIGGDPANIRKRHTMDFDDYVAQRRSQLIASIVPDAQGKLGPPVEDRVVPYQFCEDTYAGPPGGYPSCQMWDFGATMVEKVRDISSYYRNYYFFNNFRRDRFDDYSFVNGFISRLYYRTFDPLITIFKYFFFYRAIVGQALLDPTEAQGIEFGKDYARAAMEGLNLLGEVLQTPDWGRFCQGTAETERFEECDAGELCPEDYFEDCEALGLAQTQIPFGVGRMPFFEFGSDLMFKYDVIGSIFEKELAIQALTDTMSVFYGMDFSSNFGLFEINPYRLFQQEMVELFTGLITGENEYFSGVLELPEGSDDLSEASYRPRLFIDPGKRYPEGFISVEDLGGKPLVDGMINSTLSFYAALYGIAMMSSPFDGAENFSNYTRIVLAGSGDDYLDGVPEELSAGRICTFTDPKTLFTYKALETVDGRSIACLLMKRAQKVLDGVEVDGQMQGGWYAARDTYEQRKAAYEANPNSSSAYKLYVDAKAEFERIDIRLNGWLDRIVMLRDIQAVFEPGRD